MPPGRDLVFIGDVHLGHDDPALPEFVSYLDRLASIAGRIVLMGDLFNLWLANPRLEQSHHRVIVAAFRRLREIGVETHYLEGNRDYQVARWHRGTTFDEISDEGLLEEWAGRRIWAAHGDLVNVRDTQYRLWRRVSRSGAVWRALSAVPARHRFAIAEAIERRMRSTNTEMKRAFPEGLVRSYAEPHFRRGLDAVALGHFHVERDLAAGPAADRRIFVVPAWKEARRHLRVEVSGRITMEAA